VHGELKRPYGIPYRCLVPEGSVNLLVACRGGELPEGLRELNRREGRR